MEVAAAHARRQVALGDGVAQMVVAEVQPPVDAGQVVLHPADKGAQLQGGRVQKPRKLELAQAAS